MQIDVGRVAVLPCKHHIIYGGVRLELPDIVHSSIKPVGSQIRISVNASKYVVVSFHQFGSYSNS